MLSRAGEKPSVDILGRLSFQLYSARNFPPLEAQLAALAGLGFANVEPYGGQLAELGVLKAALRRHGLRAPSMHVSLHNLMTRRARTVASLRDLGVGIAIIPFALPAERPEDLEDWRAFGRGLSRLAAALAGDGLRLAWHNHDFEFSRLANGACPLDLMLGDSPGLMWEADIGWICRAGEDPVFWLERYRERVIAVHIKDVAPAGEKLDEDGWTEVGAGIIDWGRVLPALKATDADLLVLEHDNPKDFEAFARRSRAAVAAW